MEQRLRHYLTVTAGYWAFTITDGAIRMLVVLYFHLLGYSPFEVAMLFLFYEFFGVVTNLVGGWLGARIGLNLTMHIGMGLQIIALGLLAAPETWLSVPYVMAAQALSGIAKDLNKMSAKASVKMLAGRGSESQLFKWVAILTGSKNALKGFGFFVGAALLEWFGFQTAMAILAGFLLLLLIITGILLPTGIGRLASKPKFTEVFSRVPAINLLSAARFFLFASRDVWFVVALPVFLYEQLHWSFMQVGMSLAIWIIAYGLVQASAPKFINATHGARNALLWVAILILAPVAIALALSNDFPAEQSLVVGLIVFGIVFAINSAVHSYLILAYSDHDKVAMNVGFYYMANAGGRLLGTVLSGLLYQWYGLVGCLWASAAMIMMAILFSVKLPVVNDSSLV